MAASGRRSVRVAEGIALAQARSGDAGADVMPEYRLWRIGVGGEVKDRLGHECGVVEHWDVAPSVP